MLLYDPSPQSRSVESRKQRGDGGGILSGTMTSYDVMNVSDKSELPFSGEWLDFLGRPEKDFYMVLSAQPGHGKSTFALKFANYLTTFGRVIYFTNEENASRIRRKLQLIDAPLTLFDINFTAKTPEDINSVVAAGGYKFVFIDSSQNSGMDATELWDFHNLHHDTALIAIARQTKDGKTRGSQNKEYDGDITVVFPKPGTAQTIKNRFADLSKFVLFEPKNNTED